MRKRWNIKESFIPQLNSYSIFSPTDALNIHDLFDLVTKTVLHREKIEIYVRYTIGHGMALLGLGEVPMTKVWLDKNADKQACMKALSEAENRKDQSMLQQLWYFRHRLALLPESWRHLIEGHPVLGRLKYDPERLEIASIADGIIGAARNSMKTMHEIDNLILKIWGVTDPLPPKTMGELAHIYPDVLELNGWYSREDFGLPPKI